MSEEDIAARHFVAPAVVKQRLRLASVSPKLHDIYAEDGTTLEQLMAFSVSADQTRQEQVWENVSRSGYDEPYKIWWMLTENTARASDRRVQFIGLKAYEQAGDSVLRDLSEHDDGGWVQDVALLDRLVTEKLKAEAEAIGAEGWKWISVAVDSPTATQQACASWKANLSISPPRSRPPSTLSTPSRRSSKPNIRMRMNCPKRSTSVSARSRRRCWHSKTGLRLTIRQRLLGPTSSSLSIPKDGLPSIEAMSGLRIRRLRPVSMSSRAPTRRRLKGRKLVVPQRVERSRSQAYRPKPRRMMKTRQGHCQIGSSSN